MQRKKPEHEKAKNKGKLKISILIPAYNNAAVISEAIESAIAQRFPYKEIIVVDDKSTDDTVNIVKRYADDGVQVIQNPENLGIGVNLVACMQHAKAPYVIYLCADDKFADPNVCSDVCYVFDNDPKCGVVDRPYYQFIDKHEGAVTRVEDNNIYLSSCCPSGMAFRRMKVWGSNKMFIEMPLIVVQYLKAGWKWMRMNYDTVAVRIHPGGNTGTKSSYYVESPIEIYSEFLGKDFAYYPMLIQLKNRAPKLVHQEIKNYLSINPKHGKSKMFWLCAITATIVPGWVLRPLSAFYRHRISRRKAYIIKRRDQDANRKS